MSLEAKKLALIRYSRFSWSNVQNLNWYVTLTELLTMGSFALV